MIGGALPLGLALTVESASACPSSEATREALVRLSPEAAAAPATVRLAEREGELVITFVFTETGRSEERAIPAPSSCPARAEAAALVVAAWLGDRPEAAAPETLLRAAAVPLTPAGARPSRLVLGAAALLDPASGRPGARLELGLGAPAARWGSLLSLGGLAPRTVALGPGTSRWTRLVLAAGPRLRSSGALAIQLDAAPALALTIAEGSGYDVDGRAYGFTAGGTAAVRIVLGGEPLAFFVEARGTGWLRPQRVVNELLPEGRRAVDLPRAEAHLGAGLSFSLPPPRSAVRSVRLAR